jgi:NADPH2:quinone reductase
MRALCAYAVGMKAIRIHKHGGPEVLVYEDAPIPSSAPGEAIVRVHVAGVNFVDTYYRVGLYKPPALPCTLGTEGAGIVSAVGAGVEDVRVGDRVAYAMALGSYGEFAAVPAWKLALLPDSLDFKIGAATMLQGMTAHYLCYSTYVMRSGDIALVHAGAGGVGLLLIQIVRRIGARVIATAGTPEKAELARAAGANETILYSKQDFEVEVKKLTGGRGVDVVYDGVGAATYEKSLNCLRPRGYLVLYGNASGPVPAVDPLTLMSKGSLFLTRPTLNHYASSREEIQWRTSDLFKWVLSGDLKLRYEYTFPLSEAARAQAELEGRRTTGKVLLLIRD